MRRSLILADWLRKSGSHPPRMVEVGVWDGKNAAQILHLVPDCHLVMVDPWRVPPPGDPWNEDGISKHDQAFFDKLMNEACQRTHFAIERRFVLRMTSLAAAEVTRDELFDVEFLDGCHDKQSTLDDLNAWWPKLKHGGICCVHDFVPSQEQGVKAACREWEAEHPEIEPFQRDHGRIGWTRKL